MYHPVLKCTASELFTVIFTKHDAKIACQAYTDLGLHCMLGRLCLNNIGKEQSCYSFKIIMAINVTEASHENLRL